MKWVNTVLLREPSLLETVARRSSVKKLFLEISQNSRPATSLKRNSGTGVFL